MTQLHPAEFEQVEPIEKPRRLRMALIGIALGAGIAAILGALHA